MLRNRGDFVVKERSFINPDMVVDEIMRKWPATVAVALRYRMLCVGCPIGTFHTVAEACREHQVNEADFLVDLESAVRAGR
ncbi:MULTISPECIES: DUF1858 domain-containing protein [unclassified Mesorhizobium]|uniref:DUF1858 domain-containing protein n=1 Tax=unclassified Mesorhizobium TaxID=325217 RepID=UPI00167812E1|nr:MULTISPECIES: DUF1858 domain-containing protein [unclassified Mesorhizobium]